MPTATKSVTELPAWNCLSAHFQKVARLHMRDLFAQDPKRGERLTAEAAELYLDYSKNRITDETLGLLLQLAEQSGLRARSDVRRRDDQYFREAGRSTRSAARAEGTIDPA
jgi:glucose-6-phosphate isomerase